MWGEEEVCSVGEGDSACMVALGAVPYLKLLSKVNIKVNTWVCFQGRNVTLFINDRHVM